VPSAAVDALNRSSGRRYLVVDALRHYLVQQLEFLPPQYLAINRWAARKVSSSSLIDQSINPDGTIVASVRLPPLHQFVGHREACFALPAKATELMALVFDAFPFFLSPVFQEGGWWRAIPLRWLLVPGTPPIRRGATTAGTDS
jgi:hypothetical protein